MEDRCCDCHIEPAAVTVQKDGFTLHLCPGCAAAHGAAAGGLTAPLPVFGGTPDRGPCPGCAATLESIRASGHLGCASCWEHYEAMLRPMALRLHGSDRHVGRGSPHAVDVLQGDVVTMESVLRAAVAAEAFEEAAAIRDTIKAMRGDDGQ